MIDSTADLDMLDHHGHPEKKPAKATAPTGTKVKFRYAETWIRDAETEVNLDDVREWAAAEDGEIDPADVEITDEVLSDYLTEQFNSAGPDLPGWHPRGEGLKGYDFDRLEVWTAEATK
jgi:hypothetical protein